LLFVAVFSRHIIPRDFARMEFASIRVVGVFDSTDDFRLAILTLGDEFFHAFRICIFAPR
jgi:hypothetical protein